jgi:WD40 repeat protein
LKHISYRERDYPFGQMMLTLRTAIGLTQTELADYLGVSRRAVGEWEAGGKYPKADHLKAFIVLAVQHRAFHAGHGADEIRALWRAARQKVLLDELWLTNLLAQVLPTVGATPDAARREAGPARGPRVDWDNVLAVPNFYGREWELAQMTDWIVQDHCRVVGVLGLGGIGKSAVSVNLMHQVAEHFDVVIWRSLRDAPTCAALLDECLQVLASQPPGQTLTDLERRLSLLLEYLREQPTLLVLDNLETLLEEGEDTGQMRPGYEAYEKLLRRVAETEHQSCLLFTSREKPISLVSLEGSRSPVRVLRLAQLEVRPCEQLLAEKGVAGTDSERTRLIEAYAGNPLALIIVAQTIVDLFNGEIATFLDQGEIIFGGIRTLLAEQFLRLSALEQSVLLWLAIMREPSTLDELLAVLVTPVARGRLLETIQALHRRSLIERGQNQGSFTLQSVVLEYVTARFIAEVGAQIREGKLAHLIDHALELAQAREYIRQTQERLIIAPILMHLRGNFRREVEVEEQLLSLVAWLGKQPYEDQGYAPANLLALIRLLRGNLRGLDLSGLALRSAYLQGAEMQNACLVNATIRDSIFTEAFDVMTAVAIDSTGEFWAAASRQGEILVWEAKGRRVLQRWRGHTETIWTLDFSPDGRILASGSWDSAVKVWDVSNGGLLWSGRHSSQVNRVEFSPNGNVIASAGNDASVQLWDLKTGVPLQTLQHPVPVSVLTWSPDGHVLASGDVEGQIRLWAMNHAESVIYAQMLPEQANHVDGLAFAPDGRTLASGDWNGTVTLWDVASGHLLRTLVGHTDRVARVAWSPDGRTLASSSSNDQRILLWDVEQSSYRAVLQGHSAGVYGLTFTPDNTSLLSGSKDGTLRLWDIVSGKCARVIYGYAASVYDVDWSPDSTRLVSGGTDTSVTIWDVTSGTTLSALPGHGTVVCAVGWSSKGRWVANSESEHAIQLWDLESAGNSLFLQYSDHSGNYFYRLAWSPDGQYLASGTNRYDVLVWDVTSAAQKGVGRQFPARLPQVAWSPNGTHLAGGGDDGAVYVWDAAGEEPTQRWVGHHSLVTSVAWSPDGTQLASGASNEEEGELFVWDVLGGKRLISLSLHSGIVSALAWDSSGERLICGGGDSTLRCWDVQRAECMWVREAHQGTVHSLRRSPDGTKLASCGDDGAIMLWDLHTGEHLQTLRRDRPYESLDITGIQGLTDVQKATLRGLGAVENVM